MKKYLIKETYTDGCFTGKSFLLKKGDYVVDEKPLYFADDCYTLRDAKRVCTMRTKKNNEDVEFERREEQRNIARGKQSKSCYIYDYCKYEPVEVDVYGV